LLYQSANPPRQERCARRTYQRKPASTPSQK
jgi:hypothetical protein